MMTEPAVFDQSAEDGRVILLSPVPPPEEFARARRAIDLCPVSALSVTGE